MTVQTNEEKDHQDHVSIESIRTIYSSCFTCGVDWKEEHVSLDCAECGGYAMTRPCPDCNGCCTSKWTRNLTASHSNRVAAWEGTCSSSSSTSSSMMSSSSPASLTINNQLPNSSYPFRNPTKESNSASSFHNSSRSLLTSNILSVS